MELEWKLLSISTETWWFLVVRKISAGVLWIEVGPNFSTPDWTINLTNTNLVLHTKNQVYFWTDELCINSILPMLIISI